MVFEHKAEGLHDPANVLTLKQNMVDHYSCIFTQNHINSLKNNFNNVTTHRKQQSVFNAGHFVSTEHSNVISH